jgi:D-alanine-D-alanine ligase-like ATP-grasp enzyme
MLNVSSSLPDIAVLRGGKETFTQSLAEGAEVLASLTKLGYHPVDVLIDRHGNWTAKGKPTDPHTVFTQAHTIVDTTRMKGELYQALAKKMGIALLFSQDHDVHMDREDMYRILRQHNIKTPDTYVVRARAPLTPNVFRELWSTYHTPLLVRPLTRSAGAPSKLVRLYADLEKTVREYHEMGVDVHILTYRKSPTMSLAVLPNFRNEKLYTPVWVETFDVENSVPNKTSPIRPHMQAPTKKKEEMKKVVTEVYNALGLHGPACIDVIERNGVYIVVNVDTAPSLRKESRFMQSLATTGVDSGHYIHACITNEFER